MGFEGKLAADSDVSAARHALMQHNDNASHIAFIDCLRVSSRELNRFGAVTAGMQQQAPGDLARAWHGRKAGVKLEGRRNRS
jgi:hypothetical protein